MSDKPDVMTFVNEEDEWLDEDDAAEVCGHTFQLQEFNQAERHLWLRIREENQLLDVVRDFQTLRRDLEDISGGTILEKKKMRVQKIDEEINNIIEGTPIEDWTDEHDARVDRLVKILDSARAEIEELERPAEDAMITRGYELQMKVEELREKQSLVYLEFVWNLAKSRFGEERQFAEFLADAKGSDRLAAQEVVDRGNFTWEAQVSPRTNRAQRRAARKAKN